MNELILVADDDPQLLALLEKHLTAQGYHVAAVSDGVQATLKAKEIKPALVITDIQMPGAYGSTVYENLRADPLTAKVPVLFMSGSLGEEAFRRRIPGDPKNAFLKKPFDLKTLELRVKELLSHG